MKKAISLLLTFLIIASVFVMGVGTASAATSITSVKITGVKKPVAGEHPDYSGIKLVTEPADAAEIVEAWWCDYDDNELTAEATFAENEKYYIYFTVKPKSGYSFEFDEDYDYTGNTAIDGFTVGYAEERTTEAGSLYLDCKYVTVVDETAVPITSVTVTGVKKPVAGENIDYTGITLITEPADSAEIVEAWWCGYYGNELTEEDTFAEGEKYFIYFTVKPKSGYRFEFDGDIQYTGNASIDGFTVGYAEERTTEAGSLYLGCKNVRIVDETAVPITSVTVTGVKQPVAGENIDYTGITLITEPADAAEIVEAWWCDYYGNELTDEDIFIEGEKYFIYFAIRPVEGYRFEFDGDDYYTGNASIEGFTVYYADEHYNEAGSLYLDCEYVKPIESTPVTSVTVTGVRQPIIGEHPGYMGINIITEPADATEIVEMCWCDDDGNELTDEDIFIEGEKYYIYFTVRPKSGYSFEFDGDDYYTGDASIEGYTVRKSEERFNEAGSLYLACEYVKPIEGTPVTSVKVTGVKNPVAGEYPDYSSIKLVTEPADAAEILYMSWASKDSIDLSYGDTFAEGEEYYIYVIITLKDGFCFKGDENYNYTGDASIDGFTVDVVVEIDSVALYLDCGLVEAAENTNVPITSVNVTGVKNPVAGEHPDYSGIKLITEPADSAEIVKVYWCDYDYNELTEEDTFAEGEKYFIYFTVRPKEGYRFEYDENYEYTGNTAIEGLTVEYANNSGEAGSLYLDCEFVTAVEGEKYLCGDVDLDGKVTVKDATLIQKHLAGLVTLSDVQLSVADANGDGKVSVSDATTIQKYLQVL